MTTLHATHMHICMCVKKKVSVCTVVYGTNIRVRRYSRPFIGSKKIFFCSCCFDWLVFGSFVLGLVTSHMACMCLRERERERERERGYSGISMWDRGELNLGEGPPNRPPVPHSFVLPPQLTRPRTPPPHSYCTSSHHRELAHQSVSPSPQICLLPLPPPLFIFGMLHAWDKLPFCAL